MHAIGIDMSKHTFHAAFDAETVRIFENTAPGIALFFNFLEARGIVKEDATIGVEATGAYHLLLCSRGKQSGWRMVVINPIETHHVARASSLRRVKTDRTDALLLRNMIIQSYGYPFGDTDATLVLKTLIGERDGLAMMRAMAKTRMEAHATKQQAIGLPIYDSLSNVITAIDREMRVLERKLRKYEPETQKLLRSIPGVGPLTAAALVAFVGDVHRFASPEKLVAYIGLDCRVHKSGISVNGKGFISKRGNVYLRKLLFNAAYVAYQWHPEFAAYFKKKTGEGKHYFNALCAVERKLVHLIYAVWKRGTPFEVRSPQGRS